MRPLLASIIILISGCATSLTSPPIDTKPPLNLRPVEPISMKKVKLHVIHMGIAEKKFQEIENTGQAPVVFALTGADYKNLAINIQKLKSYIKAQQKIINSYKKYYEGENNDKAKK